MNILVADDEPLARSRLIRIIEKMGQHIIVGEASDGKETLLLCEQLKPDIVLLDIRMPDMNGLEAALHISTLESPPAVVFTTAYSEHALEAFDRNAVDYLLKPVRSERLEQALAKAKILNRIQLLDLNNTSEPKSVRTHISAQISGKIKLIPVDDIYYFQADQKYVTIRYVEGEVIIDDSLKSLEDEFSDCFIRIHRNALVALAYLGSLERATNGQWQVNIRQIDEALEVSRRHMTQVRKQLKQLRRLT